VPHPLKRPPTNLRRRLRLRVDAHRISLPDLDELSAIRKLLTLRLSDIAAAVLLCKLHCSGGLLDCLATHGHVQGFLYSQNAPGGRLSYHRLEPTLMGVQP
jgi:hypothetical protein